MTFEELLKPARSNVIIVGTNSLIPHLERSARFLADLLILNKELRLRILCESDNENFSQSLCTDSPQAEPRVSFAQLRVHRDRIIGTGKKDGLIEEIRQHVDQRQQAAVLERIAVHQVNLRLPVNVLVADGNVYCAIVTTHGTGPDTYFSVDGLPAVKADLIAWVDFLTSPADVPPILSSVSV